MEQRRALGKGRGCPEAGGGIRTPDRALKVGLATERAAGEVRVRGGSNEGMLRGTG